MKVFNGAARESSKFWSLYPISKTSIENELLGLAAYGYPIKIVHFKVHFSIDILEFVILDKGCNSRGVKKGMVGITASYLEDFIIK